jgi:hypothetical protein
MRPTFIALIVSCAAPLMAHEAVQDAESCELNLWTGEGVSIANWLIPEVNFQAAAGSATTDPERLAVGHHDPDRHGITMQNIEFSLSARLGANAYLFSTYATKIDHQDHWRDEFEEYYVSLGGLPLGARIKAGRFYTQFGYQNRLHPHDFVFVDQYLVSGRVVGDDSNGVFGAELALPLLRGGDKSRWSDRLTVSFGAVPDTNEEPEDENGPESHFEAEGGLFQDHVVTVDYTLSFAATTNSQWQVGVSGAWGKNNFERHSQRYGAHLQYLWTRNENGKCSECAHHESGEFFRWRTEGMLRRAQAMGESEDGHALRDTLVDGGLYTTLSYGFPSGRFAAHLRGEYVSGSKETGLAERCRISPAIAWYPEANLPFHFKVQYNYDHIRGFGDEHSVWAQFSLTWGDCCAEE